MRPGLLGARVLEPLAARDTAPRAAAYGRSGRGPSLRLSEWSRRPSGTLPREPPRSSGLLGASEPRKLGRLELVWNAASAELDVFIGP